jgi:DNA-binding transcriptional MerR regulator
MLIGELACRTGVPARLLRYYEEQDLLHPERDSNGYRRYGAADVDRVEQIRGLLDSGLTTEIIRRILPYLACGIHLPAQCLTAETAELLEREAERLGQRIDCLSRNRDAILGYLAAVRDPAGLPERGAGEQADLVGRGGGRDEDELVTAGRGERLGVALDHLGADGSARRDLTGHVAEPVVVVQQVVVGLVPGVAPEGEIGER